MYDFVIKSGHKCYKCGEALTRDSFSIEHIVPWLDSEDPVGLFFDLENIAYSHLICNIKSGRRPTKKYNSIKEKRAADWARHVEKNPYCPEKRKLRYKKYGT